MTLSGKNTYAVVICKMATVGDDCSHIIQDKLVISMNLMDSISMIK